MCKLPSSRVQTILYNHTNHSTKISHIYRFFISQDMKNIQTSPVLFVKLPPCFWGDFHLSWELPAPPLDSVSVSQHDLSMSLDPSPVLTVTGWFYPGISSPQFWQEKQHNVSTVRRPKICLTCSQILHYDTFDANCYLVSIPLPPPLKICLFDLCWPSVHTSPNPVVFFQL